MGERGKDPKEKTCAICGKEIYAGEDWAYKRRIHGERTLWFCSYKHMREYDAKTEPKKKELPAETEPKAPPAARTGRPRKPRPVVERVDLVPEVEPVQCIAHVTDAEIEEAMKNMRQRHDNMIVPGAQEAEEPQDPEKPKVDPKIAMEELSKVLSDFGNNVFTKERVLRILDEAALDCQKDQRIITMSSTGVKATMLKNATVAAENVGIMKLRSRIREMLGAEDDG